MPKNPTIHIDEASPQFTRNVPNSLSAHLMKQFERSQVSEVVGKSYVLEKWFKAMEGFSTLSLDGMCLVSDLVIPPKLKVPNFDKYKGDIYPRLHLVMFYQKMASYAHEDKLMIHYFK